MRSRRRRGCESKRGRGERMRRLRVKGAERAWQTRNAGGQTGRYSFFFQCSAFSHGSRFPIPLPETFPRKCEKEGEWYSSKA